MGHYIYAIASTAENAILGCAGMPEAQGPVSLVSHKGVAAVVSPSPELSYKISRENTMAHQLVMDQVMAHHTILPVKFGTVADTMDLIYEKLLTDRHEELKAQLEHFSGKVELGLKMMWRNMGPVYETIVEKNSKIKRFRDRLNRHRGGRQNDQIQLGEMVAAALEEHKRREASRIQRALSGLWEERCINAPMGDAMIINHAYLVKKADESAFDRAVDRLESLLEDSVKVKYVGPAAPSHFIELQIQW